MQNVFLLLATAIDKRLGPFGRVTYALDDCFDMAFGIKYELQAILNYNLALTILTDFKSPVNIIARSIITIEKRVMIDMKTERETYDDDGTPDIRYSRPRGNVADGLIKLGNLTYSKSY